jgi:peptide chain release factor subunit 1
MKRLRSVRGTGTELVSIYVPPDYSISEEMSKLRQEHDQASNIKSKVTRLNVQDAIEKMMQYLKLYKTAPKNGIAVFAGNISSVQSNPEIELFSVEPPQPIKANIYRCDSEFLLSPIEEMLEAKDLYVLLTMDGKDATIGLLRGTSVHIEKKLRSFAHGKMSKGGQSALRFERLREESIEEYFKNIGDAINAVFVKYDYKIKGVVVGGPGPTKENFIRSKNLNYQIKVLGQFDIGSTDEHAGMDELLERAKELLAEQSAVKERQIMERFLGEVARGGLETYGYENVKKALQSRNVATLIVSDDLELTEVTYKCSNDGQEFTVIEQGNFRQGKHQCGGSLSMLSQKDVLDEMMELADAGGVEVVFISTNSQYGNELFLGFKGIAAMLRHR